MSIEHGELTALDRCDKCSGQAYVRVILPSGNDLMFCGHHWVKNQQSVAALSGVRVHSELGRLTGDQ